MIALACVLAYLAASLYGARSLYSRFRARTVDRLAERRRYRDPVAEFNEWERGETVAIAVLAATLWPLTLVGFGVYRFVTNNPTLSRTELDAERDTMARRIRDLERELGIKETQ